MSVEDDNYPWLGWRSGIRKMGPLVMGGANSFVDVGYAIMPNGDIITSDGKPRDVDERARKCAQEEAGRPLAFRFRTPKPREKAQLRAAGIIP